MQLLEQSQHYSGTKYVYMLNDRITIIVEPKTRRAEKCPWVWRAEFFDIFAQVDNALLELGYVLVYHCLSDQYGCPNAVKHMKDCRDYIVPAFSLHEQADLFGFSRGGLYACNYALAYPQDIHTLYLDAPVLDLKSWPLCLLPLSAANQAGFATEAGQCMECYGFADCAAARSYCDNPVDHLAALSNLPVLLVAGDSDTTVPYADNGQRMADALSGGDFLLILKAGCGHWPHSLEDPAQAVQFITSHAY